MSGEQLSLEQQMIALQKRTKCPYAEGKLFIFVQAMDPYGRRRIVLECPAKRRMVKNSAEWKVDTGNIERLCCSPSYDKECEWYTSATQQS